MDNPTTPQNIETSEKGTIAREFPDVWIAINSKSVSQKEIDEYLLEFHLEIVRLIEEGKKPFSFVYMVNDLWQTAISKDYVLKQEVEDYILQLTEFDPKHQNRKSPIIDYIDAPSEKQYSGNLKDIKKRAGELLHKLT